MKKFLKIIGLIGLLSFSLFGAGNVPSGQVAQYSVTITKMELYNSSTDSWVIMSDTSATVDIASATAGAEVASMISPDVQIPFGTYTQARATIGNEFTIKACGNVGDDCTTGGTAVGGAHTVAVAGDGNPVASAATVVIDFTDGGMAAALTAAGATALANGCVMTYTFPTPLTIDNTTESMNVTIAFNVNNVLQFDEAGNYIVVDFPTVSISFD